jgi:hypothetical protein
VIYSRNLQSRQEFFKPEGIWDQAVTKSKVPHRTIIIAEFSVSVFFMGKDLWPTNLTCTVQTIGKEAEECLQRHPRDKHSLRTADPLPLIADPGPTIFDKKFALGVVDEIHTLRNANMQWEGALTLLNNCCVRQGATATPIWTGYKVK